MSAVAQRLETDFPATNRGRDIKLWPLWQTPFNNAGTLLPTLGIMLAVAVFVLLIACANVGNLLLVRSFARRHEMTVRVVGGAHGKSMLRSTLVVLQVSLSFLLLVGAGLLMQSLQRIRNLNPGFSTKGVLETAVDLRGAGYELQRAIHFNEELLDRVRALPGIESAAFARNTPLSYGSYSSSPIAVDGYQPPPDEQPTVEYNQVGPGYFSTIGIPLLSGREFTRADNETAAPVAIVNDVMVAQYWRGDDPVGKRLQVNGQWRRVIGVAKVSKYQSVRENPKPFFYLPLRQDSTASTALNMRTHLPADN